MEIFKTLFNGGICEHLEEQIHLVPGNLFPGISLAVFAMIPILTVGALDHSGVVQQSVFVFPHCKSNRVVFTELGYLSNYQV